MSPSHAFAPARTRGHTPPRAFAVAAALALALLLGLVPGATPGGAATPVTVALPGAHGVVDYGDAITYQLAGSCAATTVRVLVTVAGRTLAGPADSGCTGTVRVPSLQLVTATGYAEGDPATVRLVAGAVEVPLRLQRLEPTEGTVVAGAAEVVPATDPFGGVTALSMGQGDVVDLGPVDLDLIESATVRNLVAGGTGMWELRVGAPDGRAIASGALGTAGSLASTGSAGWYHSVAQLAWRTAAPVVGDENVFTNLTPAVGQTPNLYLAIPALADQADVLINWVDLNGSGASDLFRFPAEAPGRFEVLFDGSSFDGWQHTGPGRFVLTDGAMRAEHQPHEIGWAWLWYSRAQYSDFVLRLRFKVEAWGDNGGVLLRHGDPRDDPNKVTAEADEIQIQEGFENHTGGIAHTTDATRLATNLVGEWNQLEVVVVGDTEIVRINGREVARHTTTLERRSGFISVENEQLIPPAGGNLWYDDIRVHRCTDPADALCRTS